MKIGKSSILLSQTPQAIFPLKGLRRGTGVSSPREAARPKLRAIFFIVLAALASLPYVNSLHNGFVYDDFDQGPWDNTTSATSITCGRFSPPRCGRSHG